MMTRQFYILFLFLAFSVLCGCQTSQKDKDRADLHLRIGISHYQSGNYPQALAELLKADKLDSKNQFIKNNLGLVYFVRNRYELAEINIKKAVELDPSYTDARNNLVRVYIELKDYNKASAELQKVLADLTYGGIDRAYFNEGLIYFNQNEYKSAEKSFLKSIAAQRDNCLSHNYYGRSIFEQKDYERAIVALDKAIFFCQKISMDEPHYYAALANYRIGQVDISKTRFEEIIRQYPTGTYLEKSKQMLKLIGRAQP